MTDAKTTDEATTGAADRTPVDNLDSETTGLLLASLRSVHRLEMERWFLLGVVYALLIAFLIVVTRGEY